jgi:hypothetical protein
VKIPQRIFFSDFLMRTRSHVYAHVRLPKNSIFIDTIWMSKKMFFFGNTLKNLLRTQILSRNFLLSFLIFLAHNLNRGWTIDIWRVFTSRDFNHRNGQFFHFIYSRRRKKIFKWRRLLHLSQSTSNARLKFNNLLECFFSFLRPKQVSRLLS